MNLIFIRPPCSTALGTVVVCALLVVGCKKEKTTIAPIQTIEVTAVKVEPHDVPITFEWVAQTESSRQVDIRARVEGILEKRVYKEGAIVQEGQVMFEMERKPFEERASTRPRRGLVKRTHVWPMRSKRSSECKACRTGWWFVARASMTGPTRKGQQRRRRV